AAGGDARCSSDARTAFRTHDDGRGEDLSSASPVVCAACPPQRTVTCNSVRVDAPVVLVHEADEAHEDDDAAEREDPPTDRDRQEADRTARGQDDRPPAPRRVEAVLVVLVLDLAVHVVHGQLGVLLLPGPQAEADHEGHAAHQEDGGKSHPLLEVRHEAVDDRDRDEEEEPEGEDPTGRPHLATSLAWCEPWPAAASSSSSGWFASNAGRSGRMRGR